MRSDELGCRSPTQNAKAHELCPSTGHIYGVYDVFATMAQIKGQVLVTCDIRLRQTFSFVTDSLRAVYVVPYEERRAICASLSTDPQRGTHFRVRNEDTLRSI